MKSLRERIMKNLWFFPSLKNTEFGVDQGHPIRVGDGCRENSAGDEESDSDPDVLFNPSEEHESRRSETDYPGSRGLTGRWKTQELNCAFDFIKKRSDGDDADDFGVILDEDGNHRSGKGDAVACESSLRKKFDSELKPVFDSDVEDHSKLDHDQASAVWTRSTNTIRSESESDLDSRNEIHDDDPKPRFACNRKHQSCFDSKSKSKSVLGCVAKCDGRKHPRNSTNVAVLYTTSLRTIRKTFEDCRNVRFLLETLNVRFYERDVSMHMEFREELRSLLETPAPPPRLFVKGRYVGGAEEVIGMHERGELANLLVGIPIRSEPRCHGCGGLRFLVCSCCHGSRKVVRAGDDDATSFVRCPVCNENGLIQCPICCS